MAERFGRASVQYDDWSGTVALDLPDEPGELERIAGIDPAEWAACGIEIFAGGGLGLQASVVAVRRSLVRRAEDWERVARENGGAVPVTRFGLPDGTALGLLRMFKRSVIRAVPREVIAEAGIELEIVDTVDPRQDEANA